jgi:hypothetical protein
MEGLMWTLAVRRLDGRIIAACRGPIAAPPDTDLVEVGDGADFVNKNWIGGALAAATAAELEAWRDEDVAGAAQLATLDKRLLATCATIAKRTEPGWPTMTIAQRVAAVQSVAADWRAFLLFAVRNL